MSGLTVHCFPFKPSLLDDIGAADLIISHCGAGSILEILRHKKIGVGVVNNKLMDNHQMELAGAMRQGNYMAVVDSPSDLAHVLLCTNWRGLKGMDSTQHAQLSFSREIYRLLSI